MTAIVGILCRDGVVIGADRAVTFSAGTFRTIEQSARKLRVIKNKFILAGTGQIGLNQRMEYEIESFISKDLSKITNHVEVGRQIAQRAVNNFATTQGKQGSYGCLVAFELSAEPYLCEYAITDMQPEFKYPDQIWYVSMGSGQTITDPFLGVLKKLFWKGDKLPSVKEAMLFVVWTLQAAVDLNAGGVNGPIDLAVLEKKDGQFRARLLGEGEMQEHLANLKAIEEKISEVRNIDPGQSAPTIPQPPET